MNAMVCAHCKDSGRITKPVMVPYIARSSRERHSFWACWYCDSVELWPVFTKQSPPLPRE